MTTKTITPSRMALGLGLGLAVVCGFGPAGFMSQAHAQSAAATTTTPPAAASTTTPAEVPAPAKAEDAKGMHTPGSKGLNNYLATLHKDLKITPAEEPLWTTFADAMRDNATALGQAYRARRDQLPSMTALQDMNSFIDVEQKRLDGMKRSAAAFAALYAAMPADQQKVADGVFLADLPGGPHHKGHKGMHKAAPESTPAQ